MQNFYRYYRYCVCFFFFFAFNSLVGRSLNFQTIPSFRNAITRAEKTAYTFYTYTTCHCPRKHCVRYCVIDVSTFRTRQSPFVILTKLFVCFFFRLFNFVLLLTCKRRNRRVVYLVNREYVERFKVRKVEPKFLKTKLNRTRTQSSKLYD